MVEETTQDSSPESKEVTTQPQTETDIANQSQSTTDNDVQTEEERKAFQAKRLNEKNRELKAELEAERAKARGQSPFDAFRPQPGPSYGVSVEQYAYQDPTTGQVQVNWQAYESAVRADAAKAAQITAQQTTQELLDEQSARTKHPTLFADEVAEQEIADLWLASKLRGENRTISAIADSVAKRYDKILTGATKEATAKVLEDVTEKEQAALVAANHSSQPAREQSVRENIEDLRLQTRLGGESGDLALASRMSKVPYVGK